MKERTLHLVDYQNMVYRYASSMKLSAVVNSVTVNTGVLYGVVKYVKSIVAPTIFCIEGNPKLFRDYYPEYKGNRSGSEGEDSLNVPVSVVLQTALKIAEIKGVDLKVAYAPHQEADQVVSSLTKAVFTQRLTMFKPSAPEIDHYWKRYQPMVAEELIMPSGITNVVIKTTDSDMYQLVGPKVKIAKTLFDNEGGADTPKAVNNVEPETIPVYKAFVGDVSDNIPNLVKQFDSKRLKHIMEDVITNKKELDDFIFCTENKIKVVGATDLQRYVRDTNALSQLKVNRKVTTLDFYSMPWSLRPEDSFDLYSVLKKYKVKL